MRSNLTDEAALKRRPGTPLYAQLRDLLRQQILDHTLPAGAQLPTEHELMAAYGVSRGVVRQALGDLVAEGILERRPGRGSVVTPPLVYHRRAEQAGGLRQHLAAMGLTLRTELLSFEPARAPANAREVLGHERAFYIERLRFIEDEAAIYMRTWVSRERFPGLSADQLDGGSLLERLAQMGARPAGGPRQFRAVSADTAVAGHFGVAVGSPVILMSGATLDLAGHALESFEAWHRPNIVFDTDARVGVSAFVEKRGRPY
jgi:GntR family transcriptional regulator